MMLMQINPIFRLTVQQIIESEEDDVAELLLTGLATASNQAANYRDEVVSRSRRSLPSFFAFKG